MDKLERFADHEELSKEVEELKKELLGKVDLIYKLEGNLEKIHFLLGEWLENYSFDEKPDPMAAMEWLKGKGESSSHEKQSITWFWEYNKIHDLIDISTDYVLLSKVAIKESNAK